MARKHSSKVLEFATKLGSREAGFVFALFGVLSQTVHTWFITVELSSLDGWLRFIQAGVMSIFLNGALLYFILKGTSDDPAVAKRYRTLVNWFAVLEMGINLYYWAYKYMIEPWPEINWGRMIIAIPFAILLPIVLASYSYEVRVDDYSDNDDDAPLPELEDLTTKVQEVFADNRTSMVAAITEEVTKKLPTMITEPMTKEELDKLSNVIEETVTEKMSDKIPAIVASLASDSNERVDMEFSWKDGEGHLQTRILPNVRLKKSEPIPVELMEDTDKITDAPYSEQEPISEEPEPYQEIEMESAQKEEPETVAKNLEKIVEQKLNGEIFVDPVQGTISVGTTEQKDNIMDF